MGFPRNPLADLIEMQLHRPGVRPWQHEGCACSSFWTDGAEQIGVPIALIGRLSRAGAPLCPQPRLAVLLAKARFILEPDFYRCLR